jgi:hypothetical protein
MDPVSTADGCIFDLAAANRAVEFFEEILTFTIGEWMGRPFILQLWQQSHCRERLRLEAQGWAQGANAKCSSSSLGSRARTEIGRWAWRTC